MILIWLGDRPVTSHTGVTGLTGFSGDELQRSDLRVTGGDGFPQHGRQFKKVTGDGLVPGYRSYARAHKDSYGGVVTVVTAEGKTAMHLITTKAVEKTCRCGSLIYTGVAEGMPARVDIAPLDQRQEIAALLEDRWTFALTRGRELIHRHEGRIRGGLVGESIHAQHRCPPAYTQPTLIGER